MAARGRLPQSPLTTRKAAQLYVSCAGAMNYKLALRPWRPRDGVLVPVKLDLFHRSKLRSNGLVIIAILAFELVD